MLELRLPDDRARLRLLEERDVVELYSLIARHRDDLARWLPWAAEQTEADTLAFIRATRRQLGDNDGLQTAIVVDGAIAGMIGVHGISWPHRATSLGYWLAPPFTGRGIATDAVRAYVELAFTDWDLIRVELQAAVDNERSRALAQRVGFQLEGIRRQAEIVGGRAHDLAVYGLLTSEWPPAPG